MSETPPKRDSGLAQEPGHGAANSARLRHWRMRVFAGTWLSYAGYYFGRKPFYQVKGTLQGKLSIPTKSLSHVGTAYLAAYSVGQFNAAAIGTRLGPRRMILAGMAISMLCNVVAGIVPGFWPLLFVMSLNGLAQATGWPGNVGTMAHWTRREERGTIMGFWSTCYQVGGLLAGLTASYLLGLYGWKASFFGGAATLLLVIVLFSVLQRNRPEDVGLSPLDDEQEDDEQQDDEQEDTEGAPHSKSDRAHKGWDRNVRITLLLMGGTYFSIKFVRYLLLSWAAFFLQIHFNLRKDHAGYVANIFDLTGTAGTITAGIVSDRVFHGRRTPVILIMLAGMTLSTLLLWQLGSSSVTIFTISLGLIGFMIYGPDSLLSAAGAIDVGRSGGAIAAAGIINGIGATGSVLQEEIVGALYTGPQDDLGPLFAIIFAAAIASLVGVTLLAIRAHRGTSRL
ncbi:MAG: MFS transporter [Deltaproteobacteria bacterium]|nr:MFS transporter [Deltaproteobacteria bacterium]